MRAACRIGAMVAAMPLCACGGHRRGRRLRLHGRRRRGRAGHRGAAGRTHRPAGRQAGGPGHQSPESTVHCAVASTCSRRIPMSARGVVRARHGVRGDAQAGDRVASSHDRKTGLPVHSLWRHREPTRRCWKASTCWCSTSGMSARFYTYPYTLANVMRAARRAAFRWWCRIGRIRWVACTWKGRC